MNNYYCLKNIRYKKYNYLLIIILIIILYLAFSFDVYDVFNSTGKYNNRIFVLNIEMNNSDAVDNGYFVMINSVKYKYKIIEKSDLLESDNINYYSYKIKINNGKFHKNKIEKITFYYNKERLIKKIAKIII